MFNNIDSLKPRDDVLKLFEYAKSLLDLHQDNNVDFWRNMDATALEVWLREDHPDKAHVLDSRVGLTDLRELLSRHLTKMRCAAEWVHRIFEVSIYEPKPSPDYFTQFSGLCDDYPELLRDAYLHYGLAQAVQTLMIRWYLQPKASALAGVKRGLPYTFIKASDNEALARLLSARWATGDRFYADRDLLHPIIGDVTNERKVLLFAKLKELGGDPHSLVSANASPVIEQGPRTSRLAETFSNGNLRLPISASSEYLELVRSRVAVLYLLETGALFVEYPWHRFGSGQCRLQHDHDVVGGTLSVNMQCPVERRDEIDEIGRHFKEAIVELPELRANRLKVPA
ncbi:hypothetical protein [Paraburkholderia aspalathi]|uniref:Uncharacterized protein n=1 Tax=Paraburkholderia aspalathi TaxID=1324617 RepID=A0A1I7ES91_9BURK|nr:hypothetical protein [Paraburkholderia aspalathi]SFU26753.1 hypothetical protein SAMN05192563_10695 [Paraburkholderia aspalathi]